MYDELLDELLEAMEARLFEVVPEIVKTAIAGMDIRDLSDKEMRDICRKATALAALAFESVGEAMLEAKAKRRR